MWGEENRDAWDTSGDQMKAQGQDRTPMREFKVFRAVDRGCLKPYYGKRERMVYMLGARSLALEQGIREKKIKA